MSSRQKYVGSQRKLLLAFDIGTTYSGISYSILDPGSVPQIKGVTRFPAHELISGASKIPTIIYYDQQGKVQAVGAEATKEGIYEAAEDGKWVKAEWFKFHLRSLYGDGRNITDQIPPLPLNKTVVHVFADFLRYLLQCAESYIKDTHANGIPLWDSVKGSIEFVLSHPNGWEGKEQSQMRQAAILAGLIPDTNSGHERLSFVTEGEASLHYVIEEGVLSNALKAGNGVIIVDAGGGTVDISSYRQSKSSHNVYKEIAAPECHFHGSVFVSIHARVFLENYLKGSSFINDIDDIVRCFDKTTKPRFRNADEFQYIKFGSTRDVDEEYNIRFGQLKIAGSEIAKFFEPSEKCIVAAVLNQKKTSHDKISHVVLVGGFSASDWLFNRVHVSLQEAHLTVVRPENHVNKAVSDGAISFYLDHYVQTRVTKFIYGTFMAVDYDENDPEHQARLSKKYTFHSGTVTIKDFFAVILPKNTQVSESKEFRRAFLHESKSQNSGFHAVGLPVWCYRGDIKTPKWKDIDRDNYTKVCSIVADLSHLPLSPLTNANGEKYYQVKYYIVILFGLTEIKAQISWKEDGTEKRTPAKVIYEAGNTDGRA